jgi:molecular chaperone DnaK
MFTDFTFLAFQTAMNDILLAIDFGTTRTKVAHFDFERNEPRLIPLNRDMSYFIPSVFYVPEGDGDILVGDDAQEKGENDPIGLIIGLKRELHQFGKKHLGPNRRSVKRIELASKLFAHIRQECEQKKFHGQSITSCRLTMPAVFNDSQREGIRKAAEDGGFSKIEMIDEPVAAAQHWLTQDGQRVAESVVVCDVGGGTTDFALLQLKDGRFQCDDKVTSTGVERGGNDLDNEIWKQMLAEQREEERNILQRLSSGFLLKVRKIREVNYRDNRPAISVSVSGISATVTKDLIQRTIGEFVTEVQAAAQRFIKKCQVARIESSPILLVGGASRTEGLKSALEVLKFGEVLEWFDSDYAVVLGAVSKPCIDESCPSGRSQSQYQQAKDRRDIIRDPPQQTEQTRPSYDPKKPLW